MSKTGYTSILLAGLAVFVAGCQKSDRLVTVTFPDGSGYVGTIVATAAFEPCGSATTIPISSKDVVLDGGEYRIAYSDEIKRTIQVNLPAGAAPVSVVNDVAVSDDGKTALATYVSGTSIGQALLERTNGAWAIATTAASKEYVERLRARLKFDVTQRPRAGP